MICRIIARYRARKHTTFESIERLFVLLIVFEEYSGLAYKHRALFHDTHWTDCIGLSFGSFFTIFFVYNRQIQAATFSFAAPQGSPVVLFSPNSQSGNRRISSDRTRSSTSSLFSPVSFRCSSLALLQSMYYPDPDPPPLLSLVLFCVSLRSML